MTGRQVRDATAGPVPTGWFDESGNLPAAAFELVGTGHDPDAAGHEQVGRDPAPAAYPHVPPVRACSDPNHDWFHPSCARIGVLVDGVRAKDCYRYDAAQGLWWSVKNGRNGPPQIGSVTVFWLYPESRQLRRARERWDSDHGVAVAAPVAEAVEVISSLTGRTQ